MLPRPLKQGISPSQHRLCLVTPRLATKAGCLAITATATSQQLGSRFFSWKRGRNWDSHLDVEYQHFLRRRQQRSKADFRDSVKRSRQWDKPSPLVTPWGTRNASHWSGSQKRWQQWKDDMQKSLDELDVEDKHELTPGNRRWRKRVEAMKAHIEANPYRAVFGKPFDPFWSASMWGPLVPSFLRTEVENFSKSSDVKGRPEPIAVPQSDNLTRVLRQERPVDSTKPPKSSRMYATASSFTVQATKKAGEKPVIDAKATSWDSTKQEAKHFKYDPISNRMVEDEPLQETPPAPRPVLDTTIPNKQTGEEVDIPVKTFGDRTSTSAKLASLPKDDMDLLTAENVRASMGRTKSAEQRDIKTKEAEIAALERDFYAKTDLVTKDIDETRQALKDMRKRSYSIDTPALAGTLEPSLTRLADRPHFFERRHWEQVEARLGQLEKVTSEKLASDSIEDLLNSSAITTFGEIQVLKKRLAQISASVDAIGESESSTQFQGPLQRARGEIQRKIARLEEAHGLRRPPQTLRTAYLERLKPQNDAPAETSISGATAMNQDLDDGYSDKPTGLQTSFENEHDEALEREITRNQQYFEASQKGVAPDLDDGYGQEPTGLQTSFAKEREQCQNGTQRPLENELDAEVSAKVSLGSDDGYVKTPIGLETSFAKEREECAKGRQLPLEKELDPEKRKSLGLEHDDGYTQAPVGLEKSYAQEMEESLRGKVQSLEKELDAMRKAIADSQIGLTPQNKDGYSEAPTGMETSFSKERQECSNGSQETLEKELKNKKSRPTKAYSDHASRIPIGLQMFYQQEQDAPQNLEAACAHDNVPSKRSMAASKLLEDEIDRQKRAMLAHEGRYHIKPSAVAKSDEPQTSTKAPVAGLKTIQAEGDMCPNVLKYAGSKNWYKQTAQHRAEIKRLEQGIRDRALVGEIEAICKNNSLFDTDSSKAAQDSNNEVQKCLGEHDKKLGENAYKFKDDGLEKELETNVPSTMSGTRQQSTSTIANSPTSALPTLTPMIPIPASPTVTSSIPKTAVSPSTIEWAEPALYKVVAYDSGNDIISTVTTSSNFSDNEGPMSVTHALTQLYQPARFVPSFSSLQSQGFQVISASKDLLVFRKVKIEAPIKIPNANPVDGSCRPPQVPTGNFASPTGFVNFDEHTAAPPQSRPQQVREVAEYEEDIDWRHYPRVRREEPVFSGSRRHRHGRHDGGVKKEKRGRRWRKRIAFALSVGACTATSVYLLGVGAELARGERERKAREAHK